MVGTVTLLFGGIIAAAKDDIKKSLAGSTMSQIGYMTLGAGLGPEGYVFAIALLLCHGFYKAGLFLGAGSVIHGMHDEQDMRKYGALARFLPVTYVTFGLAYLAIVGIPPFSGFFAKDPIIEGDFTEHGAGGWVLGICALIGAGLTAFYMTRMVLMTWHGRRRWAEETHPHESPPVMTAPMVVIAIGSVGAGAIPDHQRPAGEVPRPGRRGAAGLARLPHRGRDHGLRAGPGRHRPGLGHVRPGPGAGDRAARQPPGRRGPQ